MSAAQRPVGRSPWLATALGAVLGIALAVVVFFPARWLQPWVSQATQQHVQWLHTSGSIWQGQTQWRFTGGEGSGDAQVLPGVWSWSLRPTWRKGPGLALHVQAACCLDQPLHLRLALNPSEAAQWQLNNVQLQLPLQVLQGLGTPWNTLQLQGGLRLRTQQLSGDSRGNTQGRLTLSADNVASSLSTVQPLGDYEATLDWPAGQLPRVQLRTLSGHLQLQGDGQIAQGRVRFRGQASASSDSEGALNNLLNIIGRRAGRVSILTIG